MVVTVVGKRESDKEKEGMYSQVEISTFFDSDTLFVTFTTEI